MNVRFHPRPRTLSITTLVAMVAVLAGCRIEPVESGPVARAEDLQESVSAILDASADGWNRGDASAFLALYEDAPSTTYVGAAGLVEGYDRIARAYEDDFRDGTPSSRLRFEGLRTRRLGESHALAMARYVLSEEDDVVSTGPFTLVLRRVEGQWLVIHDHSSEDPSREVQTPAADSADAVS